MRVIHMGEQQMSKFVPESSDLSEANMRKFVSDIEDGKLKVCLLLFLSFLFIFYLRPHKVNSMLLVPRPRRFWGKVKKKKTRPQGWKTQ